MLLIYYYQYFVFKYSKTSNIFNIEHITNTLEIIHPKYPKAGLQGYILLFNITKRFERFESIRFEGFKSNVYTKLNFSDTFCGYVAADAIFFTRPID